MSPLQWDKELAGKPCLLQWQQSMGIGKQA